MVPGVASPWGALGPAWGSDLRWVAVWPLDSWRSCALSSWGASHPRLKGSPVVSVGCVRINPGPCPQKAVSRSCSELCSTFLLVWLLGVSCFPASLWFDQRGDPSRQKASDFPDQNTLDASPVSPVQRAVGTVGGSPGRTCCGAARPTVWEGTGIGCSFQPNWLGEKASFSSQFLFSSVAPSIRWNK